MYYPLVNERVRMSDRADQFRVLAVDHDAWVADIHRLAEPETIKNGVPFQLLFAIDDFEQPSDVACCREGWLAANQLTLQSSQECIDRALVMVAEIKVSIGRTFNTIRISRQLMQVSDRLIARAHGADDEDWR